MGVFTRTGGSIAYFSELCFGSWMYVAMLTPPAGVAFAFSSAQAIAANVREVGG